MPCSEELSLNLTEAAWVSLKMYDRPTNFSPSHTLVIYSTCIVNIRNNSVA
jgi:hypothetical protein